MVFANTFAYLLLLTWTASLLAIHVALAAKKGLN
jgi:hypothetical protein